MKETPFGWDELAKTIESAQEFCGVVGNPSGDCESESARQKCTVTANAAFDAHMDKNDVPTLGMENITARDIETAGEKGYVCKLLARGKKTAAGTTAYVEPTFVEKSRIEADSSADGRLISIKTEAAGWETFISNIPNINSSVCNDVPDYEQAESGNGGTAETKNDNSIEIHRFYIRFSGDTGGWLDIVTAENWGDGILTKPVSVKAAHNWTEHAVKYDPTVFVAGILD